MSRYLPQRRTASIDRPTTTGVPLGMLPEAPFTAGEVEVAPRELVVIYTDGIVEAADPDDEEYEIGRLEAVCGKERDSELAAIAKAIDRDVEKFARGVPYADDRTLVLLRRKVG